MINNRFLLKPKEAAALLGISERTLFELRRKKQVNAVQLSRRCLRYDISDLREFINRCKGVGSES